MVEEGIEISRVFDAPKEIVWNFWTQPEKVMKWWGPKDFYSPSAKIDFKVGGKYVYAMHGPASSKFDRDMYSAGEYLEIVPLEKIVVTDYFSDSVGNMVEPAEEGQDNTMPSKMHVAIVFEEEPNDKTKVIIMYARPESDLEFETLKKSTFVESWNSSLDKLEKVLKDR